MQRFHLQAFQRWAQINAIALDFIPAQRNSMALGAIPLAALSIIGT